MLRSASFVIALAALCLQVVLASIETGLYLIKDFEGHYLGFDPSPYFPPRDLPVQLLPPGVLAQRWFVEKLSDSYIISARSGPNDYKIVAHGDAVFVSTQKAPEKLAITSAGGEEFEIKAPYSDAVFTAEPFSKPQVFLLPAQGLPNQKWTFIRVDRADYYQRGSRNRFCKQDQW